MKLKSKTSVIILVIFVLVSSVYSQSTKVLKFKGGYFNPKSLKGSIIFSGSYGIAVDERVDLSFGISYFNKTSKSKDVKYELTQEDVDYDVVDETKEYSHTLLPLSVDLTASFPMQRSFAWIAGGGLTYEFLFLKDATFSGFGWNVFLGIEYEIGSRSSFILEGFYNSCKPKGKKDFPDIGKKTAEVNVSGIGIRGGIKLVLF
ncbi:MAG: hypothetical protein R6V04_07060 [bacterium]